MYTNEDIAYIAGLFDGEGTITIGRLKPNPTVYGGIRNPSYMLRFQVAQNTRPILQWCRDLVGFGNICENPRVFLWQAGGRTAYKVLKILRPYVRIKRPQLELAMFFQESSKWAFGGHVETAASETARREVFYDSIRCLNQWCARTEKLGELLEYPNDLVEGNQQPSHVKVLDMVAWKVQRLGVEDTPANNTPTSAQPERDDIVRAAWKHVESED